MANNLRVLGLLSSPAHVELLGRERERREPEVSAGGKICTRENRSVPRSFRPGEVETAGNYAAGSGANYANDDLLYFQFAEIRSARFRVVFALPESFIRLPCRKAKGANHLAHAAAQAGQSFKSRPLGKARVDYWRVVVERGHRIGKRVARPVHSANPIVQLRQAVFLGLLRVDIRRREAMPFPTGLKSQLG